MTMTIFEKALKSSLYFTYAWATASEYRHLSVSSKIFIYWEYLPTIPPVKVGKREQVCEKKSNRRRFCAVTDRFRFLDGCSFPSNGRAYSL